MAGDLRVIDISAVPAPLTSSQEDRVVQAYIEGMSLARICKELPDAPAYGTLMNHLYRDTAFKRKMQAARMVRAAHYETIAEEEGLKGGRTMTEVASQRLKFDVASKLAEWNDPSTYGKKTTISGDPNKPVQIVVVTGVPAPTDAQKPVTIDATGMIIETVAKEIKDDG